MTDAKLREELRDIQESVYALKTTTCCYAITAGSTSSNPTIGCAARAASNERS